MTFVKLSTECGCKARGTIWISVHACIDEIIILDHDSDLGVAVTLESSYKRVFVNSREESTF